MPEPLPRTVRGTVAKAMIAFAVLLPVLLILGVAVTRHMELTGLRIGNLTPWIVADGLIFVVGLLLHRGEEL